MYNWRTYWKNNRAFANIFSGKDLSKLSELEREKLFLKHNIIEIIKREYDEKHKIDDDLYYDPDELYYEKYEFHHLFFDELTGPLYDRYLKNPYKNYSYETKIEMKLVSLTNKMDAKEFIEKELIKNCKKIRRIDLHPIKYHWDREDFIDNGYEHIYHYLFVHSGRKFIDDYLTNEFVDYEKYPFFKKYILLDQYEDRIEFCQKKLKDLEIVLDKSEIKEISNMSQKNLFNSEVFRTKETQDIFHNLLLKKKVINSENKRFRGFGTVCYNAFNCINRLHVQIFNTKRLCILVEFLETEYNFSPKNKTKFANISLSKIALIEDFFEQELKVSETRTK